MKRLAVFILFIAILSCRKDPNPNPDIESGLVINIPLDGSAYDSVSGMSGVISKAVSIFNRHNEPNKALLFSRADSSSIDFGDLAMASFPDNIFTISCWVNVIDTLSPGAVLSKRGVFGPWEYSLDNHFHNFAFTLDNWIQDGTKTVYGTDPLNGIAPFEIGKWHHIAYTADGETLRVYLDGIQQYGTDERIDNNFFSNTDAHFYIGNGGGYGKNYFFNGCIDDIRIYNKCLDAATIQYLASL